MLRGSFHQDDARFGLQEQAGCSYQFDSSTVLKSKTQNVLTWTVHDLDGVLMEGTSLDQDMSGRIKDNLLGRDYIPYLLSDNICIYVC